MRDDRGELVPTSWPHALAVAARGLAATRERTGVLVGGRVTAEDAYGYAKFTRVALRGDDIDFRARTLSAEEAAFLAARVVGSGIGVSYADLETAATVLLVGLEPEEESPIIFLRLRKAARKKGAGVFAVAPFADRALTKMFGTLLPTAPGGEAAALDGILDGSSHAELNESCANPVRWCWSASGWRARPARCPQRFGWPRRPGRGWHGAAARRGARRARQRRPGRPAAGRTPTRRCIRTGRGGTGLGPRRPRRAAVPARA